MATIKTCSNGHNYDSSLYSTCPYCPKGNTGEKTIMNNPYQDNAPTVLNNAGNSEKTRIVSAGGYGNEDKTKPYQGVTPENKTNVPNSTKIVVPDEESGQLGQVQTRKLVGFLVSYTLNAQGKSFKLYEGKNLIGADPTCDIVISSDPGVSGKHITILYRSGKFRFKDEFSTNATFVNGAEIEEGYLENQDIIKIGKTKFAFMAIPLELLK
jgi:hypothetical protein